jgi:spore coat polysaccharide biosynthesis protein SpsF
MVNTSTTAIIQARLGSTRLPGKVLLDLAGKPVIVRIVERLKQSKYIDKIVVATSDLKINEKIISVCKTNNIDFFVGDENNVLDRFYRASENFKSSNIIRITGDCPLVDSELIDNLIEFYSINNYDYCGIATGAGVADKIKIKRFPDGMDAEIFSFSVLEKAYKEAYSQLHKEHVTPYIWQNPNKFKIGTLESVEDYGQYRLTLDNEEDYILIKWIYENLSNAQDNFNLKAIINLLKKNSHKLKSNKHLIGKEGYEKFSENK